MTIMLLPCPSFVYSSFFPVAWQMIPTALQSAERPEHLDNQGMPLTLPFCTSLNKVTEQQKRDTRTDMF